MNVVVVGDERKSSVERGRRRLLILGSRRLESLQVSMFIGSS